MVLDTNITKIGNSYYILIPSYIVHTTRIGNGQEVRLIITREKLVFEIDNVLREEAEKKEEIGDALRKQDN